MAETKQCPRDSLDRGRDTQLLQVRATQDNKKGTGKLTMRGRGQMATLRPQGGKGSSWEGTEVGALSSRRRPCFRSNFQRNIGNL